MFRGGRGRGGAWKNNPRQYYAIKAAQAKKRRKEQEEREDGLYDDEDDQTNRAKNLNFAERNNADDDVRPPGAKRRKVSSSNDDEMEMDDTSHNQAPIEEIRFEPTIGKGSSKTVWLQLISADRFSASPKTGNLVDVYRSIPGASVGPFRLFLVPDFL